MHDGHSARHVSLLLIGVVFARGRHRLDESMQGAALFEVGLKLADGEDQHFLALCARGGACSGQCAQLAAFFFARTVSREGTRRRGSWRAPGTVSLGGGAAAILSKFGVEAAVAGHVAAGVPWQVLGHVVTLTDEIVLHPACVGLPYVRVASVTMAP